MSVPLAYIGIILVWSTTPLAIKWSGQDVGFLFGVASRMILGLVASLLVISLWRQPLPRHRDAIHVYLAAGVPLFLAMSCVYWGAQFIPSGLISVVFGLTPLATGVMAAYWLREQSFTVLKLVGMILGLAGLAVIYGNSFNLGPTAHWGIVGVLGSVFFHSLGTVWMKKVGAQLPAITANTGGLVVASSLYATTWLAFDGHVPVYVPIQTAGSIVYLALVGSVLGAVLFFYALKHLDTGKIALLTLITPVTALMIGHWLNDEALDASTIVGTTLVLAGLVAYQGTTFFRQRRSAKTVKPEDAAT